MLAQPGQDADRARNLLLERCISTPPSEEQARPDPEYASTLALQKFDELHAGAEITLQLTCPGCARSETIDLDIARFLWIEVRHAALRLLREVHELASAYGWTQDAILAMTAQRRSAYLGMVHA
jgi:hypothetical protein